MAALPLSKLYTRTLRDTTQFVGWSGRVLVAGTRGREKEETTNKLATGLQDACNLLATSGALWHCYGVARVPLGGHDGVVPAERQRCCAIRAPPRVVVSAGDAGAPARMHEALPQGWGRPRPQIFHMEISKQAGDEPSPPLSCIRAAGALRSALTACQPEVANLTCAFSWKKSLSSVRAALA